MWLKGTFSVNWKTCFDLLFWLNHGYNLKSCAAPHSPCANLSAYTGFAVQKNLCKNVHGCVWLKIVHRFFFNFFFCAHGRRCIQVHIARGCKGVCESRSACFSPLYVIKTVSFVSQQAPLFKKFYPGSCVCFLCTESFYIGSGHLIIKKVNTQHSHVTRKRNVPWMIFLFLFFPSRPCQRVFPI